MESVAQFDRATVYAPVLRRFVSALRLLYADRMERAVLFGSRARGDAHADSDYDIAIFLTELPDIWLERRRLADLRVDFLDATGVFFEVQPFPVSAWDDRTPIMHEIRLDGLPL